MQQYTATPAATPLVVADKEGKAHDACDLRPVTAAIRPTRLLLACHAENMQIRDLHLALHETGLSARGWEQTIALAQWLQTHEEIDALLSDSPLPIRLTAQRIGQQLGLSALTFHLPIAADPAWALEPPIATPSSESLNEIVRYAAYTDELLSRLAHLLADRWGSTILLVADAVAIASLLRSFAGGAELGIAVDHASLSEVAFQQGRWSLGYTNRSEHLIRWSAAPRTTSDDSAHDQAPDQALNEEIEKIAHFYDQVALRLGQENSSQPGDGHSVALEMSGAQVRHFAELDDDSHVLLAGVGSEQLALDLAQTGISEVVGVDVSPGMLERAEFRRLSIQDERLQGVNFRLAPAHHLPFQDGRFDVALCDHILHHLAKPQPTLHELHRVLPARGKLVVIDIDGPQDAVKRATQNAIEGKRNPSHALIRTGEQLASLLQDSGFQVEKAINWTVERSAVAWMDSVAVDETRREAVMGMLEASIETDAAGLNVRRQDNDLRFDAHIVAFLARKVAE